MKLLIAVVIAGLVAAGLSAASPDLSLKARILQLEGQLQQMQVDGAVCTARLAMAVQGQSLQAQQVQRAALEQEAGCAYDWTMVPPACKP